jgi:hypothetical protein
VKHLVYGAILVLGTLALAQSSHAVVCANGVYRAGCAGPNGAAVVHKPVHRARPPVTCANGVTGRGASDQTGPRSFANISATISGLAALAPPPALFRGAGGAPGVLFDPPEGARK